MVGHLGVGEGANVWGLVGLAVAARTDPVLAPSYKVMARFDGLVQTVASRSISPEAAMGYDLSLAVSLVFSCLMAWPSVGQVENRWWSQGRTFDSVAR